MRHEKYNNKQKKNRSLESENNFKPDKISITDMDKFGKTKLTKKRTFTKNTWYDWNDWLINYIPEPIKNCGRG